MRGGIIGEGGLEEGVETEPPPAAEEPRPPSPGGEDGEGYPRLRVGLVDAGEEGAVLIQLAIETWTLASPDHGWFSTASTIVPVLTT